MPDFTPEQTEDARRNPKAGDVWRKAAYNTREIVDVAHGSVRLKSSYIGRTYWDTTRAHFRWTRNAKLIRRGDA